MNKKLFWISVLLLGTSTALFAQTSQLVKVGEQMFWKTAAGELVPASVSSAVGSAATKATIDAFGAAGAVSSTLPVAGATGATSVGTIPTTSGISKASSPIQSTISEVSPMGDGLPYIQGLHERIEQMVSPTAEGAISAALQDNIERIEENITNFSPADATAEDIALLENNLTYIREHKNLLVSKGGFKIEELNELESLITDKLKVFSDGVIKQLNDYIGTHFAYPALGTELRKLSDAFLDTYKPIELGDFRIAYVKTFKYLRDTPFAEVTDPSVAPFKKAYHFMLVLNVIKNKYGAITLPAWNGLLYQKVMYRSLENEIIFNSVGAPGVYIDLPGNIVSSLDEFAVFVVPDYLQQLYIKSVFERLQQFIAQNHRYPYFSIEAREQILDAAGQDLTEEAYLHLAVRRALAFENSPAREALQELAQDAQALPLTQSFNASLPAITYTPEI